MKDDESSQNKVVVKHWKHWEKTFMITVSQRQMPTKLTSSFNLRNSRYLMTSIGSTGYMQQVILWQYCQNTELEQCPTKVIFDDPWDYLSLSLSASVLAFVALGICQLLWTCLYLRYAMHRLGFGCLHTWRWGRRRPLEPGDTCILDTSWHQFTSFEFHLNTNMDCREAF